jgi:hypothetical protein
MKNCVAPAKFGGGASRPSTGSGTARRGWLGYNLVTFIAGF